MDPIVFVFAAFLLVALVGLVCVDHKIGLTNDKVDEILREIHGPKEDWHEPEVDKYL